MMQHEGMARRSQPERKPPQEEDEDVVTSAPTLEQMGVTEGREPAVSEADEREKREQVRMLREKTLEAIENQVLEKDRRAKEEAEKKLEDAFFARGEKMTEAHAAGEQLPRNMAERAADERDEMRDERHELMFAVAELRSKVAGTEKTLRDTFGIADPVKALAERATAGGWGAAKRMFRGLFSRESRENEKALDLYDAMSKDLAEKQSRFNELENRAKNPEAVQAAMKLKSERNQPRAN